MRSHLRIENNEIGILYDIDEKWAIVVQMIDNTHFPYKCKILEILADKNNWFNIETKPILYTCRNPISFKCWLTHYKFGWL